MDTERNYLQSSIYNVITEDIVYIVTILAANWEGHVSMDFYERMKIVCTEIPYGKVATYGQIALLCGKPKNARQVGYALRNGLAGAEVPAHRILNSFGLLSGAKAFETPTMQCELLNCEGVETVLTDRGYKVDLKRFRWENSMDDAERLYQIFLAKGI